MREKSRNYQAARLLSGMVKAAAEYQGKRVEVIDAQLGAALNRGLDAIQNMRNGRTPIRDLENVRAIAAFAVEQAYVNAGWLRRFLSATGYPHPQELIDALLPGAPPLEEAPSPAGRPWYDNLGQPPFGGAFVARQEPLEALLALLASAPVVVMIGLGGMGKTSLAYHVASLARERHQSGSARMAARLPGEIPPVGAVIWLSDAAQPGSTTLDRLCDTIARTLDHPGLAGDEPGPRREQVLRLLAVTPCLIVIDNAETIVDPQLLPWLLDLPFGSQVLITTRQRLAIDGDDRVSTLAIGAMSRTDAQRLIRDQAARLQLGQPDQAAQQALIQRSGGCPQAIKQLLGYAKRAHLPLGAVVAQFDALTSDLLADLFARLWDELLSADARRLLIALARCRYPVVRATLKRAAQLEPAALDAAITQLSDTALIESADALGTDEKRFSLHPLTRAFVEARAEDDPAGVAQVEAGLIAWAAAHADSFGYRPGDTEALARLEADEALLMQALRDATARGQHAAAFQLANGLEFYYYVKCRWDDKLALHEQYLAAAEASGLASAQINALTMHIKLLCRLNRPEQAEPFLARLAPIRATTGDEQFHIHHARALYHYTRGEQAEARALWGQILSQAGPWGLPGHMSIGTQHWLGLSAVRAGNPDLGRHWLLSSLKLARASADRRWIARNQILLALRDLDRLEAAKARQRLEEARALVGDDDADREQRAHLRRVEAHLLLNHGSRQRARAVYDEARELFARMGLLHELSDDDRLFLGGPG